ncbi:intercompartmental signaling factor BofC [Rossellomorea aquimaris]|uniref:intercompartmental signaling factor BofC n=1 Tax=Rossellomorea aquimaris TaxID=189382 RepID=UPI001CD26E18|nr:intercompartmental signaling factor BofC [Rossellomorea aquimaris]MCA1056291.1 intercompartmental signaling factor BofC [Rossellomorea aquimaris]
MTMKIRIVFMVMLLLGAFYFTFFYTEEKHAADGEGVEKIDDSLVDVASAHTVMVKLERVYLDGEVSEEIVQETIWSMEDFWAEYRDWQLIDMTEEEVTFQKQVDDISPLLKTNGYFGISEDGVLSIFNGKPGQAEIIQSFFQIDIEKLESTSHESLLKGIPVKSKQKFEEVLESFKQYSVSK